MKKNILVVIILMVISGAGFLLAANQGYFGYGVSNTGSKATLNSSSAAISTSVAKVEEWGTCKTITSTDPRLLFIPTKTTTERSIFITNKPSHITLGTCGCTTNADCSVGQICQGYVAPTSSSCNGTYSTLGWVFDDGELSNSIHEYEIQGCINNFTQTPSYPAIPSYPPTSVGQIANQTTIYWQGQFYISCNYYEANVNGQGDVWREAIVTSTNQCSSFNTNQTSCQSTAGCNWAPGIPAILGTCSTQICGNDIKEGTELCDGFDLGIPCTTALGKAGTKYCNNTCDGYTTCVANPTPPSGSTCVPQSCFIAGTKIKMSDGTTKPIEEITTKDSVYSVSGEKNKVIGVLKKNNRNPLYAFNNSNHYFVTEAHPFLTINGWKSINPDATNEENPGLMVTKLSIGDILITEKGTITLFAIDSIPNKQGTDVYNITVENTHDYYADGYAVHNKLACDGDYPYQCNGGLSCVADPADCVYCTVGPCDECTSTSQCPYNYFCKSPENMCFPSDDPTMVCAL